MLSSYQPLPRMRGFRCNACTHSWVTFDDKEGRSCHYCGSSNSSTLSENDNNVQFTTMRYYLSESDVVDRAIGSLTEMSHPRTPYVKPERSHKEILRHHGYHEIPENRYAQSDFFAAGGRGEIWRNSSCRRGGAGCKVTCVQPAAPTELLHDKTATPPLIYYLKHPNDDRHGDLGFTLRDDRGEYGDRVGLDKYLSKLHGTSRLIK
jgi:hypothetical protein